MFHFETKTMHYLRISSLNEYLSCVKCMKCSLIVNNYYPILMSYQFTERRSNKMANHYNELSDLDVLRVAERERSESIAATSLLGKPGHF